MAADPRRYEVHSPFDLAEALRLLALRPGALRPLAGGTDLLVLTATGVLPEAEFLELSGLSELRGIEVRDDEVSLGALTTFTELRRHPVMQAEFPALVRAARETGAVAIQNRGTLGGNIAGASPAADSPPPLLCYEAKVELRSADSSRLLEYRNFHLAYRRTALKPDELITRILLPRRRREGVHYFRKVGPRKAQAISKLVVAGYGTLSEAGTVAELFLAMGAVAPTAVRCRTLEEFLLGKRLDPGDIAGAVALLAQDIAPIDDLRSTAHYRRVVAANLCADFLRRLASWKKADGALFAGPAIW